MTNLLDHMSGALYRIGLHHEDGTSSLVALSANPVRFAVGELSASTADLIVAARKRRTDPPARVHKVGRFHPPSDIGPSTA
jgi:hypothetical protein